MAEHRRPGLRPAGARFLERRTTEPSAAGRSSKPAQRIREPEPRPDLRGALPDGGVVAIDLRQAVELEPSTCPATA